MINETQIISNLSNNVDVTPVVQVGGKMKKSTIIVAVVVITIIIIIAVTEANKQKKEDPNDKKKRFNELRCKDSEVYNNPGKFSPDGTMTFEKNKSYCDALTARSTNKAATGPLQAQLNNTNQMMSKINKQIENQNKMITNMRSSIEKQGRDVMQKLYNLYKRLAYLFKIFARIFYKVFLVFKDIFLVLKYCIWTVQSMWEGPIGNTVRVLCFGEETLVLVNRDGENLIRKITEVNLSDRIDKSTVIGLCEFVKKSRNQIYNLDGINVSGSHLVEYKDCKIRVQDHPDAVKVSYNGKKIYSLITNDGRMKIGRNYYRDYLGDNSIETYLNFARPMDENILEKVDVEIYRNSAINLYPGFTCNSYLETNNGIIKVEDIKLGDKIDGKEILGIVRYRLEGKTPVTYYNTNDHKGIMVGIQIYKERNHGKKDQEERWILGKLDCIGLLVDGGIVRINDEIKVADFDIISDELRNYGEESNL